MSTNSETPQEKFNAWKERVIEFAKEDEKDFIPNEIILKELWEFGSPTGGAADDCVRHFRNGYNPQ